MNRIPCSKCGVEHHLQDLEPTYRLPDEIHALDESVRDARALVTHDFCALMGTDGNSHRWFVRALVPFSVVGRAGACCWGLWVAVPQSSFDEIRELWDDPKRLQHDPWPAEMANDAATYPTTVGLRGVVRFVDKKQIPHFAPDTGQGHQFVEEWKRGVPLERLAQWKAAFAHTHVQL